jgi:hypothetical protein
MHVSAVGRVAFAPDNSADCIVAFRLCCTFSLTAFGKCDGAIYSKVATGSRFNVLGAPSMNIAVFWDHNRFDPSLY